MQIADRDKLERESNKRIAELSKLASGSYIHIIGVCGTGTTQVASLLKQLGFRVSGSDKAFYPPMGEIVRSIADEIFEGYSSDNLSNKTGVSGSNLSKPDFIVVGNSIRKENPEVQFMLEHNIPYASMPEVLSALLIGSRKDCKTSIVVAGTHGKTTTSCAIAEALTHLGREPGFFVGGAPLALSAGIGLAGQNIPAENRVVVLEGDEYDSAFFAKWPKFHSYRPDILVITSIDFDHGDIYESIEEIQSEFFELVKRVPEDGTVLVADTNESLRKLALDWGRSKDVSAKVLFYGTNSNSAFRIINRVALNDLQSIQVAFNNTNIEFKTNLVGEHNALNLTAVVAVCSLLGISQNKLGNEICNAIFKIKGVRRRQQIIAQQHGITIIEDFAHHPAEVKATLSGVRERYPNHRIIAVFEPRSNTSRRAYFQDVYASSFLSANIVMFKDVLDASGYSNTSGAIEKLNVRAIVDEIKQHKIIASVFEQAQDLFSHLCSTMKQGDVVVIMSNGDFEGLPSKVADFVNA